ncbi:MAG TPA: hypothetical protein VIU46_08040 [Gallionellaceae bacterium]
MKRLGFPVLLLALLAGCATPEERAARVQAEVEEMIKVYGPGCEKLGFAKDTEPWRECILRLSARASYHTRPVTTSCTAFNGFYNCISY